MATFVHVFPEENRARIRREGIRVAKARWRKINGVFVTPVVPNYEVTHQWLREVQRLRNVPKPAARIRVPDDQHVYVGRYNEDHLEVEASEAIRIVMEHEDPMGLEVIIPRAIDAKEILAIYKPPKVVGWRYHPKAKGTRPCGCSYCQRGEPFSKRLKEAYKQDS